MRKHNILIGLLGLLLMGDLILFGVVAFFDNAKYDGANCNIVRIGVVADSDRTENRKVLEDFFREMGKQSGFELRPFYAASNEEAVSGFIHGSIDLLVTNPACFIMLKEKYNAKALARQRFSPAENEYNHSALMTMRKIEHINDTRGLRLAYKDHYSMGGHLVPSCYISRKLPVPQEKWFKSITFTSSDLLSLRSLIDGKVDVIAVDLLSLRNSDLYRDHASELNTFWISPGLPETLICVSFQSGFFADGKLLQDISSTLWALSRRDSIIDSSSMVFEPIDYGYECELKKLDDYLKNTKNEPGVL